MIGNAKLTKEFKILPSVYFLDLAILKDTAFQIMGLYNNCSFEQDYQYELGFQQFHLIIVINLTLSNLITIKKSPPLRCFHLKVSVRYNLKRR